MDDHLQGKINELVSKLERWRPRTHKRKHSGEEPVTQDESRCVSLKKTGDTEPEAVKQPSMTAGDNSSHGELLKRMECLEKFLAIAKHRRITHAAAAV